MILTVKVKPNAKVTKVVEWLDDKTVVIALHAPATEGKANEELVSFLAKKLSLPKSLIIIKRGLTGRNKQLEIPESQSLAQLKT